MPKQWCPLSRICVTLCDCKSLHVGKSLSSFPGSHAVKYAEDTATGGGLGETT